MKKAFRTLKHYLYNLSFTCRNDNPRVRPIWDDRTCAVVSITDIKDFAPKDTEDFPVTPLLVSWTDENGATDFYRARVLLLADGRLEEKERPPRSPTEPCQPASAATGPFPPALVRPSTSTCPVLNLPSAYALPSLYLGLHSPPTCLPLPLPNHPLSLPSIHPPSTSSCPPSLGLCLPLPFRHKLLHSLLFYQRSSGNVQHDPGVPMEDLVDIGQGVKIRQEVWTRIERQPKDSLYVKELLVAIWEPSTVVKPVSFWQTQPRFPGRPRKDALTPKKPTADFVSTATSFDAVDPSQVEGPSDPWPDSTMLDDDEGGDSDESEPDEGEAEECDSFQQFFDKLLEETHPHQTTTKAEAFLHLLSYVVTAGLTWAQVRGLLILINTLFGMNVVPGTTYFFRKLWKDKKEALKLHFFCQSCYGYIGQIARATRTQSITCGFCEKKSTFQSLMRAASFFIMFDLKKQIEALLTHVSGTLLDSLQRLRAKCHVSGVYSDITDGDLYRSVRNQLSMAWSDLTLTFNTDGAPVFESSKFSIWPVQFFVNELPVPARWNHVTISALWSSKLHPPMNVLITQFVDEVKNMGVLSWSHAGTAVASTVHAVLACVDSPARASVLNSKQYNGYFGCSWYLQEGTPVGLTTVKNVFSFFFRKDVSLKGTL
ncbi:hypothetical protein HPB48_011157 [Haemaphysalis longicornis]|uniref:Uncharacterized protein n=1 Tax=Haemaphysalis longicornis TaxID=44386 RepID=A0A9J6FPR6_HAELO|nr:hypothetical protein HPB48_011157 [Haemaphysalis longicornis]